MVDQPFLPLRFLPSQPRWPLKTSEQTEFRGRCCLQNRRPRRRRFHWSASRQYPRGPRRPCRLHRYRGADFDADAFGDAEPRKKIGPDPDAAGASRDRDGSGLEQDLFEGRRCSRRVSVFPSAPPRRSARAPGRNPFPQRYAQQRAIRGGLSGQDHYVGRHATGKLRGNRMRPRALRRA